MEAKGSVILYSLSLIVKVAVQVVARGGREGGKEGGKEEEVMRDDGVQ